MSDLMFSLSGFTAWVFLLIALSSIGGGNILNWKFYGALMSVILFMFVALFSF